MESRGEPYFFSSSQKFCFFSVSSHFGVKTLCARVYFPVAMFISISQQIRDEPGSCPRRWVTSEGGLVSVGSHISGLFPEMVLL